MSQKEKFYSSRKTVTLSHEIIKLLLQLRVLVVDASHDGVLEGAAKPMPARAQFTRACFLENREIGSSLFLMDLVLPERDGAAADLQYRRRIQAGQHRLAGKKNESRLSTARARPVACAYMRTVL
jgi:hypothetical protein